MAAPDALLAAALLRDPARPLLTFYDDATGERTELSATTLANWVAKTANLLRDDVGAEPGDRVAVLLPAHWQTAAVLLGAWSAAAVVDTAAAGAVAAFAAPDRLDAAAGAGEIFALSLAPLGRGFPAGPPPGTRDYAHEVRLQGDRWAEPPVADSAPALATPDGEVSAGDLVEIALRRAAELGLMVGDRVLSTAPWDGPTGWVDGLLVPLAGGASVVLCVNADPPVLPVRVEAERVTSTPGARVAGVRPL